MIDAHTDRVRRTAIELRDPDAPTFAQRRADALIAMIRAAGTPTSTRRGSALAGPTTLAPPDTKSVPEPGGVADSAPEPGGVGVSAPEPGGVGVSAPEPGGVGVSVGGVAVGLAQSLQGDPLTPPSWAPARADKEPGLQGAASARVLVTLDYQRLLDQATAAGLLGDGHPLSAGDLRRLCCDADLIPIVLGTESQILDIGRSHRLVTPALRTALVLRDKGCVFPGCDAPASRCDAHHLIPWWAGGPTILGNLALLCPHHHGIVEPARHTTRDQWRLRIATDGLPELIPPTRIDPHQQPRRHQRHRAPGELVERSPDASEAGPPDGSLDRCPRDPGPPDRSPPERRSSGTVRPDIQPSATSPP